jgi:hypothetical protein
MDISQQAAVIPKGKESSASPQRQRRSIAEKRRMVEETLIPGASVARVARARGVNANQLFSWRRLYLSGRLGELKPECSCCSANKVSNVTILFGGSHYDPAIRQFVSLDSLARTDTEMFKQFLFQGNLALRRDCERGR